MKKLLTILLLIQGLFLAKGIGTPTYITLVRKPNTWNFFTNPLNVGYSNGVNEIFTDIYEGDIVSLWSVNHWIQFVKDEGSSTGWSDPATCSDIDVPVLNPGVGYLYYNSTVNFLTNTYAGAALTGANQIVINSADSRNSVGSIIPQTGRILTDLNCFIPNGNYFLIGDPPNWQMVFEITYGTNTIFWYPYNKFYSGNGPEPIIKAGQGFMIVNTNSAAYYWDQYVN